MRRMWSADRAAGGDVRGVTLHPVTTALEDSARRLRAALGFLSLEPSERELRVLHDCFDTWRGIGDVVAGMARQEYDLELRRYNGRGWRAIFFQSGFEHSLTSHVSDFFWRRPRATHVRHRRQSVRGISRRRRVAIAAEYMCRNPTSS